MKNSYKFFQNNECEWFPCHSVNSLNEFSCLFCYCPLYNFDDCKGNYKILENNIKDCSECLIPHYNYNFIIDKITKRNNTKC